MIKCTSCNLENNNYVDTGEELLCDDCLENITEEFESVPEESLLRYKEYKEKNVSLQKDIQELTSNSLGHLLHTITVECSYWEFKNANEHDAISFIARTDGTYQGEEVSDLDYSIECSTADARSFANYILRLCDEIELSKIPQGGSPDVKENK